ncbi:hypothetical protein F5148DRAFT_132473 [Russula earlei]|uniref:Uncharacterized protein n=1 Tax=Russula earlei TaxID=71964 RepID=A0ACC0U8B7_9AGAM|nr:hypothetical protein F5148DRAFT_132473 [Russula earlei]
MMNAPCRTTSTGISKNFIGFVHGLHTCRVQKRKKYKREMGNGDDGRGTMRIYYITIRTGTCVCEPRKGLPSWCCRRCNSNSGTFRRINDERLFHLQSICTGFEGIAPLPLPFVLVVSITKGRSQPLYFSAFVLRLVMILLCSFSTSRRRAEHVSSNASIRRSKI